LDPSLDRKLTLRVVAAACLASSGLVALDLWGNRDLFDADGLSYLDLADAYTRGDWRAALVALWSPLYVWLLALVMLVFNPSAQWEFTAVHALNFFIYLVTLASFSVFLREFLRAGREDRAPGRLPDWAWLVFGYSLFTWSIIRLIPPHQPQPDLLVCALLYLIFAMLLRMRSGVLTWGGSISLGALLGLGYLAKGIMFPMAFVFLGVALWLAGWSGGMRKRILGAFLVFAFVSLPYILVLSHANGRWLFSDAGRLNYAWDINQVKAWNHWQGGDPKHGAPVHPTRKIHDDPPLYEFATPFTRATYPPWYDPSYWYEGVQLSVDLPRQISVIVQNSGYLASFLANAPGSLTEKHDAYNSLAYRNETTVGVFLAAFCVIVLAALGRASLIRGIAEYWVLLVPVGAALGAYLMLHVEGRFIAAYVVVLWMVLFRCATPVHSQDSKRIGIAVLASVALITTVSLATGTYRAVLHAAHYFAKGHAEAPLFQSGYSSWKVAKYLHTAGLRAGDPVGGVGWMYSAFWARVARVRIVAEVPSEGSPRFWSLDTAKRAAVMELFRDVGAKAVVSRGVPGDLAPAGWKRVGDTRYYVYLLQAPA
jgi:hypothetical protein